LQPDNDHWGLTLTRQEKNNIVDALAAAFIKIVQSVMRVQAKERARSFQGVHRQSRKALAVDSMLYNVLSKRQPLPARPQDFRKMITEEERGIHRAVLYDALASLEDIDVLRNIRGKVRSHWGRPTTEEANRVDETRGMPSRYDEGQLIVTVNALLEDDEIVEMLASSLIKTDHFYQYEKYCYATMFYEMRDNVAAFFNNYKSIGMTEARARLNARNNGGRLILIRSLTDEQLEILAAKYATATLREYEKEPNIVLYRLLALIALGSSAKG